MILIPYTYKFSRDINFVDVTNTVFCNFIFEDHLPVKNFAGFTTYSLLHVDAHVTWLRALCITLSIF